MNSIIKDNILAATMISKTLATTLGPKGMNKLLVDNIGDICVTNDAGTIVDKVEISHPIAKMIAEVTKTINQEVGDGSTTGAVLTGLLLSKASELLDNKLQPATIIKGYEQALSDCLEIIKKEAKPISDIKSIINNVLKGDDLIKVITEAVNQTDINDVLVLKKRGADTSESRVINGVLIDKEKVHPLMPNEVKKAKILVTKTPIEVRSTENKTELRISNPYQLKSFIDIERNFIEQIVDSIKNSGANVIICQKGIDERAQELLMNQGVLAIRRVREEDVDLIESGTGAKVVNDLLTINKNDLGNSHVIAERISDGKLTIIKSDKIKTILVRGSTDKVADDNEVRVKKALKVIKAIRSKDGYLPGAGQTELMLYNKLNSKTIKGREAMAYQAFGEALKGIVEQLIINDGGKINDVMPKLISTGKGLAEGISEPLIVKEQILTSATETAIMILRIDDIIKGKSK